jgi:hypothetical protein
VNINIEDSNTTMSKLSLDLSDGYSSDGSNKNEIRHGRKKVVIDREFLLSLDVSDKNCNIP